MAVTSTDIKIALEKKHWKDFFLTECKSGSTYLTPVGDMKILDALAIRKSWTNPCFTGYEIKVSRSNSKGFPQAIKQNPIWEGDMNVLIRGMEMPTSCRTCHMKMNCDDCEGHECVCVPLHEQIGYLDDLLTDKRRDDCPLVSVPEHGRLIDADALEEELEKAWESNEDYEFANHYSWKTLHAAPTIIPAEPQKEVRNCDS